MKRSIFFTLCLSFQILTLVAQVPEWDHIPGPDDGGIENFDLDGTALYALSRSGIYRSDDEGYHWQLLSPSLSTTRDKRQLRAEKGVFYALNYVGSLVRSDDQGGSWKPVLQKPFPNDFENERLQQIFVKGDTLLVGSWSTIYRSTNRGETWTTTADLVPASFVSIVEFKNEIFAAQDRYIYRSSDGGLTWETVFTNAIGYSSLTATDSFLLAFYDDQTRLIRSTDGLRTWDLIDTDTIADHLEENPFWGDPLKWIGGAGSLLYYFQTDYYGEYCPIRFCYSSDGGDTWHRGNNGNQVPIGYKLNDGINFGHHIVLASNRIQHALDSAGTFFTLQTGLHSARIGQIIHQENTVLLTTDDEHGHYSTDRGVTWEKFQTPSNGGDNCGQQLWFLRTDKRIFRIQYSPNFFDFSYSDDQGQSWIPFELKYPYRMVSTDHAFFFLEHPEHSSNFITRIWKIGDSDSSFSELYLSNFNFGDLYDLPLYGFGDRFGVESEGEYYIFDDKGNLIQKLPLSGCNSPLVNSSSLHFAGNTYYNFCNDRCYILQENATDWQEIYPQDWTTGIPLYHSPMTFFTYHEGVIWVGLEGKGLFYATDNTGRFYPAQPQMPYPHPTALSIYENELWVGTDGGGIWTYPLPKTRIDPSKKPVFSLFPNPSDGVLNLQTDSFVKEEISFSLLSTDGKAVAKKVLSPGQYWSFDFQGLPKGVYFLQLRTDSEVYGLKWVIEN
ncbi:MAG: T9SS type A sorting domain-containing protein [Saprospiraceae bacterium]